MMIEISSLVFWLSMMNASAEHDPGITKKCLVAGASISVVNWLCPLRFAKIRAFCVKYRNNHLLILIINKSTDG